MKPNNYNLDKSNDNNENFKLTEQNLKDLQKTFEDPKILSTLLNYYDEIEKSNKEDLDNKIERDIKSIINNNNNSTNNQNSSSNCEIQNNSSKNNNPSVSPKSQQSQKLQQLQSSPSPPPPPPPPLLNNSNNINNNSSTNNNKFKNKKVKSISGFCFKTCSNKNDKVYVMISHYPTIGTASITEEQGWIIPYSLFELENQQSSYTSPFYKVYHIIFGTDTYNESTKVKSLNRLLIQTSIQAIQQKFKESLNIVTIKLSKKQFQKEFLVSIIDDKEIEKNIQYNEPQQKELINDETGQIQPVFTIQNIGINNEPLDNLVIIPKFIEFNIKLPKINNLDDLSVEIEDNERLIVLEDNIGYYLNILLKHHVEDEPIAKFNKKEKNLYLKLKVIDELHSHSHNHNSHNNSHKNNSHNNHNHNHNHNQDNCNNNNKEIQDDTNTIIKELDQFGLHSLNQKREDLPINLNFIPKSIIYNNNQFQNNKIIEIEDKELLVPQFTLKQNYSTLILIIYENSQDLDKDSLIINYNSNKIEHNNNNNNNIINNQYNININYKKMNNKNQFNLKINLLDFFFDKNNTHHTHNNKLNNINNNNHDNQTCNNNNNNPEESLFSNTKIKATFNEYTFIIELNKKKNNWW